MSRIKEKLSKIYSAQIPEFIRVGEFSVTTNQPVTTTSNKKIITVGSTADIVAGDKLVHPGITNTIFVTKVLSSSKIEVSDDINVTFNGTYVQFLRSDATSNFIKFLTAYYTFLEQDQGPQELLQNVRDYADSDHTIDSLLEEFFKNYGNDIPRNIIADKSTFIKHFKDIYKTKGAEESYKLLFRVLFNTDASFKYPKDVILKTSDGLWKKDRTMRVTEISGDPFELINAKITGDSSKASAVVDNVLKLRLLNRTVYELYLSKIKGTFTKETISANKLVTAPNVFSQISVQTVPILTNIVINDGAAGYSKDNKISIDGVYAKINSVTNTGEIKEIAIVEPSVYFDSSVELYNVGSIVDATIDYPSYSIFGNISINNNVGTFVSDSPHGLSKGKIANIVGYGNVLSYLNNAENIINVTTVLDTKRFRFDLSGTTVSDTNLSANLKYTAKATILPTLGIVKESVGYWLTNRGKISELNYIQGPAVNSSDPNKIYYQPYSYVVQSDVTVDNWQDIATATVHPAGTEVFGEILINSKIYSNLNTTANSEIWDYIVFTADKDIISADVDKYTNSRVTDYPITIDMVYTIFGYL